MTIEEGKRLKEAGIEAASQASFKPVILRLCREHLKVLARSQFSREVTADDAAEFCEQKGWGEHALGNSAGALFRGGEWIWTGRWIQSKRDHAHANMLRVWKLREGF